MTAYWIGRVDVTDPDAYGSYAKLAGPVIEKHGGRFLARGGKTTIFEGPGWARTVVVEFPTVEAAVACYNSPEYQQAHALQVGAAQRDLCVVEGL